MKNPMYINDNDCNSSWTCDENYLSVYIVHEACLLTLLSVAVQFTLSVYVKLSLK